MSISKKSPRIILNISGEIFETHESTLARFPTTLLGNKLARLQYFHSDHHFFERNRMCFEAILHFYQSNGTLNFPLWCLHRPLRTRMFLLSNPEKYRRRHEAERRYFPGAHKAATVPSSSYWERDACRFTKAYMEPAGRSKFFRRSVGVWYVFNERCDLFGRHSVCGDDEHRYDILVL